MIAVSTFCVDQFEASLVRVADGSTWCPFDNPGTTPVRAISVANAVPQAYIDEVEAAAACTNAGKRLCTDSEWLRACQGPSDTTYPYGNTHQPGTCNDARAEHPAVEYFGTTDPYIYTELDNSCLDQLPETVDRTGSLTSCVTAEGAFDMMGNLNEWTNDPAGSFRGGYYVDTVLNGPGCTYVTTAHDTQYWDFGTGFRCCAD
jgi:formylglycine-generating enzyme